jgi:hypothetical protein
MSKSRRKNHHWNQKEQESFFLRSVEKTRIEKIKNNFSNRRTRDFDFSEEEDWEKAIR